MAVGVRVQENALTEMQEHLLLTEATDLFHKYGFSHAGEYAMVHAVDRFERTTCLTLC
jgi:hypothetical protein